MKKVGIVGYGYVGKAMDRFLGDHYEVRVYDPHITTLQDGSKAELVNEKSINECEMAIVCVPTAMAEDGSVDLSIIEASIKWIEAPLILIKSTIPPGTTQALKESTGKRIVFSPEYIGESTYITPWWKDVGYIHPTDIKRHDFQIFGGDKKDTSAVLEYFKVILGPVVKYMQTDSTTAELVKYMENSWGATKVVFVNEFAKIADAMGVDFDEARELWLLDGRINRMHTAVFKEKRGFSGKCLPKDINGIVKKSIEKGYKPEFLEEVIKTNQRLRK